MDYSNIRIVNQPLDPALGWTTINQGPNSIQVPPPPPRPPFSGPGAGSNQVPPPPRPPLVDQEQGIIKEHHHRHHLALPLKKIKVKLVLLPLTQEASEDVCIAGFIFGHLVQIEDFGYI